MCCVCELCWCAVLVFSVVCTVCPVLVCTVRPVLVCSVGVQCWYALLEQGVGVPCWTVVLD